MAKSSRARAVNKQNTAVLYYEPSENVNDAPVSTARVVGVGATPAAHGGSGATLQLVGRMLEGARPEAPQVAEVEPPQAAARRRPVDRRPTRVIAYNVHIVASDGAEDADETRFVDTEAAGAAEESRSEVPDPQYDMRGRYRHREQELELTEQVRRWTVDPQFRQPRAPQNEQFQAEPEYDPTPGSARSDMPRAARERMPFAMPPRSPRPQIPMSLFGALENMGTMRAHAGSYKQLLAQHLAAGQGPLFSNRNLCIAVGAYALILFLLALFTS